MPADSRTVEIRHLYAKPALKMGLLGALVASIITVIVLSVVYLGLDSMGVVSSLNQSLNDLLKVGFNFGSMVWVMVGFTVTYFLIFPIAAVMIAVIYNLCAALAGGVKVSVHEDSVNGGHPSSR